MLALMVIGLAGLGLALYRDFGLTWDDPHNLDFGRCNQVYVSGHGRDAQCITDESHGVIHGPFFETAMVVIVDALGYRDPRPVFLARHLMTFALFAAGMVALYRLGRFFFVEPAYRALVCVLVIATPRLFGDAFVNSVDIAALAWFVIGVWTMFRLFERPSHVRAAVHGVVSAMAVDTRLTSLGFVAMTIVGGAAWWFRTRPSPRIRAGHLLAFMAVFASVTILLWPYLWAHPVTNFVHALGQTAAFSDQTYSSLYLGRIEPGHKPWHYTLVWMCITIPVSILGLFAVGLVTEARRYTALTFDGMVANARWWSLAAWLFAPVAASIVLHTTLYNGWRHHYFVYPAFVIFAVGGLRALWRRAEELSRTGRRAVRIAITALVLHDLAGVITFMVRAHPYESLYFNQLVGGVAGAHGRFEIDYWAISLRGLYEKLVAEAPRGPIRIMDSAEPIRKAPWILPTDRRARLRFERPGDYTVEFDGRVVDSPQRIETVELDGVVVSAAYAANRTVNTGL
jgi:hypothetical protein